MAGAAAGAALDGVEGEDGVGGGDCKTTQICGGDAVAGEFSAFRFFMALVSLGVESS